MNHERWARIECLFHEAAELPAARRAAFLDDVARQDAGLQAEVEALLEADAGAAARLRGIVGRACMRLVRSTGASPTDG